MISRQHRNINAYISNIKNLIKKFSESCNRIYGFVEFRVTKSSYMILKKIMLPT